LSIEQVLAEEVRKVHGVTPGPVAEALQAPPTAQAAQSRRARKDADLRSGKDEDLKDVEDLKAFYRALNRLNRAALCLSGGGIRSATFCLGVIQALAMASEQARSDVGTGSGRSTDDAVDTANRSLLSRFHYLSTVSGGGYIGSWLSAWRKRDDFPTVWRNLTRRPEGSDIEPTEISWLRAYSNYLTPRIGIFSADSWTGVAIYLRNLILNLLVIVPALALVVLILKLLGTVSVAVARIENAWWPAFLVALIGVALLIVAQAFVTAHRPTRRTMLYAPPLADTGNVDQRTFLSGALIWSLFSALALTSFLSSQVGVQLANGLSTYAAIGIGAAFGAMIFAAGWLAGWPVNWKGGDLGRWAASGFVYGALLGFGAHLLTLLSPYMHTAGHQSVWVIIIPVVLGVPWVLASQLFAEMIFVGLVSYEPNSDADREWLGRAAGWLAATAIIWMLTTFIAFAAGHFLINVKSWLGPYIASAGGVAGIIGALVGRSAQTLAKADEKDPGIKAIALKIILAIAGPIFAVALVIGISVALDLLLLGDSLVQGLSDRTLTTWYIVWWLVIGLLATGFVAWVANQNVNINRFSLHALYRNRLVRAYLGASRQRRCPDKFTGFDEEDNLPAHELWPPKACASGQNTFSLFHVVNITLNVVQSKRLAWQERKAEAFTVSPLHSGAAYKGFRPSSEYGKAKKYNGGPKEPCGISLGTAMAISGAAASPNMGYHSSPSVTLLLALFNARLGWWLGNPGPEGEKTYKDEGPATAIVPLVQETFGLSTDDKPYVYLSDGGHFENLGLYEMVRRRCRFIVAIDAGCDPDFAFEDLGNAVRKIFIDLGIRITFKGLDRLKNRPTAEQLNQANGGIPYHAVGTIHYSLADGESCKDGAILYIKPAVHGTDSEGAGVRSYAAAHKTFPHETTADQWFTEAQFESYRSLGLDIMNTILECKLDFGRDTFDPCTLGGIMGELMPTLRPATAQSAQVVSRVGPI
jgi:hypothetical protein